MPTYTVYASNTIYLKTDIEADSWEQADEIQKDFIVDDFEETGREFSIDLIEEK